MNQSDLIKILKELNSPNWHIRLPAAGKLKGIDRAEDCLSIYEIIEKEDDSSLRFHFLQALDDYMLKQNGELEGAALFCLVNYSQSDNKKIKARSIKLIESFIHSPDVIRYQKLSAVRMAWDLLTLGKRKYLTEIILTNKLTELVPLILVNFNSNDSDLIRKTIDGLRTFGDSRGNQFIKLCLNAGDKELRISAVKALGQLGGLFDYKSIKPCLIDEDSLIQIAAVSAYGKLLGRFAYKSLVNLFRTTDKVIVKKEILNHLGKQRSKKSLEFLVELYLVESNSNISLYCEWALYESHYRSKVEYILKKYRSSDLAGQYKLLGFLEGIYSTSLVPFYVEVIKLSDDSLLVMTAIDSLSNYNDKVTIEVLMNTLANFKGEYSSYAFLSLLKIKRFDASGLIEKYIENKMEPTHSGHEVVLKALKSFYSKISKVNLVEEYLFDIISSGKLNQKVLALEVAHFFKGERVYSAIVKLLENTKNEVLLQATYKALVKIISLEPDLLDHGVEYFNDSGFSEVFLSKKSGPDIVRKIGVCLHQKPLDFAIHFLYLHGRNLSGEFIKNILLFKDGDHVDFYLSYMEKHSIALSRKQVQLLQNEFYDNSTNARKLSILSLSCLTPDQKNFSFFYDKVNELFGDSDLRRRLTGFYMRGLCE